MKLKHLKIALVGVALVCSSSLMAQKKNVVSAAVEYKKFQPAFFQQKFDEAKEVLLTAKGYIDQAMVDPSTKDDAKAHYYNAIIHFNLMELSGLPDIEGLEKFQEEEVSEMVDKSIKIAHNSRKFKRDVEDFVNQRVSQASMFGKASFDNEDYKTAFIGFVGAYKIQKMIDIEDDVMKENAVVSAINAIKKMKDAGEVDEALEFIELVNEQIPDNNDLIFEGINLALAQNNLEKAEEFFNVAAESNPDNVSLFITMGSTYLATSERLAATLKGMDTSDPNYGPTSEKVLELFNKAEVNLKRAIEIEPANLDANYNLGVMYLGKAQKIEVEAGQLDFNDPNYNAKKEESDQLYEKAIAPLEAYIEAQPDDVNVLQVLFQVHRKAGNTEQALEYKRRAEELGN